ncbi:phospholipase A2-like isoform X2 [Venturia canescens]|nr:phospholipase A2-like isoform X2 [Venturia canescens]XP_043287653.1 phospholipase A2-like isoform X2 [Venturia canescens]
MLLGRRSFLLIFVLGLFARSCCQSNEDSSNDESNESELIGTYRTPIERLLQGFLGVVSEVQGRASNGSSDGIGGFLNKIVPKPIKNVLEPVEKITIKGFGDLLNHFEDRFHAIYPGTLWCGGGNIAKNDDDLGVFAASDACCQAHDKCPENIEAGNSLGPLLNNGAFTRSACFCDQQFYHCLKNVSSPIATNIGITYFNVLRPQCFALEYPIEKCARHARNRIVDRKCAVYKLDTSKNKTLEWFDNPDW